MNDNVKITGIITSVDDTLSEIGPVKATLIKTFRGGDNWHIKLDFDYKGEKVTDYTIAQKGSEVLDISLGAKLLENFLNVNPLLIKFDNMTAKVDSKVDFPENGRGTYNMLLGKTHTWEGRAYVPVENSWYRDTHLERKL